MQTQIQASNRLLQTKGVRAVVIAAWLAPCALAQSPATGSPDPAPDPHAAAQPTQAGPPPAQQPATAQERSSDPAVAVPQRPRVYKWTDAQGKTYYGDIRPNQAPDATAVPNVRAGSQARTRHEASRQSGGDLSGATPGPGTTLTVPDEADRQALVQRLNTLVDELTTQIRDERGQPDSATPATNADPDSSSGTASDTPSAVKPQVYKWTDAQGKIHYATGQTGGAANPTVVPIAPSSAGEPSSDLTERFNAMAQDLTEQRLAPLRSQQQRFNEDLQRMHQKELAEAEARAAAAQAEALRLQKAIEAQRIAEQQQQEDDDYWRKHQHERRHERRHERHHHENSPPPSPSQPTPAPEPPRPVAQPQPIVPFTPKAVGVSSH